MVFNILWQKNFFFSCIVFWYLWINFQIGFEVLYNIAQELYERISRKLNMPNLSTVKNNFIFSPLVSERLFSLSVYTQAHKCTQTCICTYIISDSKMYKHGTWEMFWWSIILAAIVEDLSLVPRTHVIQLITALIWIWFFLLIFLRTSIQVLACMCVCEGERTN